MPRTVCLYSVLVRTYLACTLLACGGDEPTADDSADSDDTSGESSATSTDGGKDGAARGASMVRDAAGRDEDEDAASERPQSDAAAAKPDASLPREASVPPAPRDAGSGAGNDASVPTPSGDAGTSVSGIPAEELATLRQVCLDEINRYRATLSLTPMQRASEQQELCSDQGAKKDGDSGNAHSSAGRGNPCAASGIKVNFQSQNTCPGYPVGGRTPTIADALKGCLSQMWAEGEPPEGEEKCLQDYFAGNTKCFLAHGHYINMKGKSKGVSCGFYKMANGRYWMNQDFGR